MTDDPRCRGCWQYRITKSYRGVLICAKCWRRRKTIHGVKLYNRKKVGA